MTLKRQMKINKMFDRKSTKETDDCEELKREIEQLENTLKEKQNELFQIKRNKYRQKLSPPKKKPETFIRPQKILVNSMISSLQKELELMSMLSGVEVQSYVTGNHCCIVYHMQHPSEHEVKHGLRINLKNNVKEIEKLSMPVGFNIEAIVDEYEEIIKPECLLAIRKGLVAYYDRLQQFEKLKEYLILEAQPFRTLDGSYIEIQFVVQAEDEEELDLLLRLDYKIYDIRPKSISFQHDLPGGAAEIIREQCTVFKRKPLTKAFKEAFINPCGEGRYQLVRQLLQMCGGRGESRAAAPCRPDPRRDDTFLPERTDSSDADE